MTATEASRQHQLALEYRRVARERYSTDEELAECDEAVENAYDAVRAATYAATWA